MLWGKGDSSGLTEAERETLSDLRRLVETGHIIALTPDQAGTVLKVIRFYDSVTATGGVFVGARNVTLFIGSILVIWWAIRDWVVQFIRTSAGG